MRLLAEPPREQRLAERVVELVRAGVAEVLALEVEPLARARSARRGERRGAAGVRRAQVVRARARKARRPRAPRPARLELVERRDQRLGDVAAAVGAVGPVVIARASGRSARTRVVILDAGLALEAARRRRPPRAAPRRSPRATFSGPSPPASMTRPSARGARGRVVGIVARARGGRARVGHLLAVAQEDGVAGAMAVLARVELDEVGAGVARARRRRRRPRAPCRARRARPSARRGLSRGEDEAGQVGARLGRDVDVLLARQAAHLHERPREQLARASRRGSGARMSAEPTRIASAPASSAAAPCARVRDRRSRRSTTAVARRLRDELELARGGRSRTSRGRAR